MLSHKSTNNITDLKELTVPDSAKSDCGPADLNAPAFHPLNKLERVKSGMRLSPRGSTQASFAMAVGALFCGAPEAAKAAAPALPTTSVRLAWEASLDAIQDAIDGRPGTNTMHIGTQSGIYPIRLKLGREAAGVTITNLVPGCTYFFAVEYSNEGGKSDPSNEVDASVSPTAPPPVGTPAQRAIKAIAQFAFCLNSTHPITLSIYRSERDTIVVTCHGRPRDIFELQYANELPTLQNQHTAWQKAMQGQINEQGTWWIELPVQFGNHFFRTVNYGTVGAAPIGRASADERGAGRLMAMLKAVRFPAASKAGQPPRPKQGVFTYALATKGSSKI